MPSTESALIQAILDNPGDEVSRLALADFLEEHKREGEPLRGLGWWEVVYDREWKDWDLWWRYERPGMALMGLLRTAILTRKMLPRCSECGKRAHWTCLPSWQWKCKRPVCIIKWAEEELERCKQATCEK